MTDKLVRTHQYVLQARKGPLLKSIKKLLQKRPAPYMLLTKFSIAAFSSPLAASSAAFALSYPSQGTRLLNEQQRQ